MLYRGYLSLIKWRVRLSNRFRDGVEISWAEIFTFHTSNQIIRKN